MSDVAQDEDVAEVFETRHGEVARAAACGEDEVRVGVGLAGLGRDIAGGEVDGGGFVGDEGDGCGGVPGFVAEGDLAGVGDEGFGEFRAVDGGIGLAREDGDGAFEAVFAESLEGAGGSASAEIASVSVKCSIEESEDLPAYDDYLVGALDLAADVCFRPTRLDGLFIPLDPHPAVPLLDGKLRQRVQGRGIFHVPARDVEARSVPGARQPSLSGVTHDALDERSSVMGAIRRHGMHLAVDLHE